MGLVAGPDTLEMILAVAQTHGCAPAQKILMRPETLERCAKERGIPLLDMDCQLGGIPIEIDQTMPYFPGFQVVRERW